MKEYRNEHIIVYWYPERCAHVGYCLRLPQVFDLRRRPWVDVNGAPPEEIIRVINQCPSGALKYALPEGSKVDPALAEGPNALDYAAKQPPAVKVTPLPGGPLVLEGPVSVFGEDGGFLESGGHFALCRCGASARQPFCDGSHRREK